MDIRATPEAVAPAWLIGVLRGNAPDRSAD